MPRRSKVDRRAVREAPSHGVARRAELHELGVSSGTIQGRTRSVRALLAEAVQRRFTTVERLTDELAAGSQRGSRFVRIALIELGAGVRSAPEARAREIVLEMQDAGFPRIEWNRAIHLETTGARLFTPDGWMDEVAAAWEIGSVEYHLSPEDQERSYERRALMNEHDLVRRPPLVARDP